MSEAAALAGAWDELVSTALLGTDRRPLPAPLPGALAPFGVGPDPALNLLDRAAVVQAARRAGAAPASGGERLPACSVDERVPCPTPAARRFGEMLAGQHPALLPELLRRLVERDLVLPPEHLVAAMDRARSDPELQPLVVASAGPVVPWLARLLPQLGWPLAPVGEPQVAWARGTQAERLEVLRQQRAVDPAAGRSLLEAGVEKERAEHRAACYAALAVGLSPADETLLEQALDDRSPSVRQVAAGLLARLPSSAWAGRMADRALEMIRIVPAHGQDRLDVRLVAPVPPEWERDGVTSAAPAGTSLGAHVLHQVLSSAPLATWAQLAPPADLVVLASEHELGPNLCAAWAVATARQRDAVWARLLVEEIADPELVSALDAADLVAQAIRHATPDALLTPFTLALLETLPRPWPPNLVRPPSTALIALFVDRRVGRHHARQLARLVRALDPSVLVPLANALAQIELAPPLDGVRDDVAELARFRAAMLAELS
jgi:Family of unknown function (DUF5691)